MHKYTQALKVSTLAIIISFGLSYAYAWTPPTSNPPAGNVSAPINTSATSQTKAGDIAVNGATHFLDTGTTVPETPAGGTGAIALNGWPNFSDVAANAVKLAGLTSADILSAQTSGGSVGMGMYVAYGNTTCATGWTTAYTGRMTVIDGWITSAIQGMTTDSGTRYKMICDGTDRVGGIPVSSVGVTVGLGASGTSNNMTCAVCVR